LTELTPLQLTAQEIRGLSKLQNDVADGLDSARLKVNYMSGRVAKTHGSICSDTVEAVTSAESERERACQRSRDQSRDLSVKLESAATKYEAIDAQEKARLDEQMQPGG
jgi:hypothetical protein